MYLCIYMQLFLSTEIVSVFFVRISDVGLYSPLTLDIPAFVIQDQASSTIFSSVENSSMATCLHHFL